MRPVISTQSQIWPQWHTHTHTHTHTEDSMWKKEDIMHITNRAPLHIYQWRFCWFSCRDHTYILYLWLQLGGDRSWILHFDSFMNTRSLVFRCSGCDVFFFLYFSVSHWTKLTQGLQCSVLVVSNVGADGPSRGCMMDLKGSGNLQNRK